MTDREWPSIGFIGAGKIAQTLARAFGRAGLEVSAVASRSASSAEALAGATPGVRVMPTPQAVADVVSLVFLTIPDDAIEPMARNINWRQGQFVVHCSGATPLEALRPARDRGAVVGGFHPLQMFADPEVALQSLPGCAVGLEAPEPLASLLSRLAAGIGCQPFVIPPGVRPLYHASATYVGPFVIAVLREATTIWASFGVQEGDALDALLPLLRGTIEAVMKDGLAGGMGGCVARGDVGTVRAHLAAIDAFSPTMGQLYRELTRRTIPLGLARGSLVEDRAEAIAEVIAS